MGFSVHGVFAAGLAGVLLVGSACGEDAGVLRLEAALTASPSATQLLTEKCAALKLASPPVIQAVREKDVALKAGPDIRKLLAVTADARLGYRRVKLTCGAHLLSEADNWYVPGRLTAVMNRTLETTEIPFGTVVRPLNFRRKTLKMEPLDEPEYALRVTALLVTGEGAPFSLVIENYSRELATDR
jgi:chorismate-pyruvate lyase